ncbi:MAG TPA: glycosyltransferase family 39 protein, partial [Planctomycetia bacterium]|nr:glycosyltransferase family 39 protein [Planctomycetia bacterium]
MRAAPWLRTPALAVVLATAAAIGLRLVAMQSAIAPARDALRYLHAAKTLPELKLTDWLQLIDAHPLYPAALWAGHAAYVAAGAEDGPWAWIRAGQWIGIASQVCWLLAAYSIGARLWSPRTAFLGCLLTALLPRTIWYSADLLADSLHAALWTTSLALLVGGWRNGSRSAFLGAGLTAGLAYLTRVEALQLPATALAAGTLALLSPGTNRKRLATGLALFAAGWAATGGPYVAAIGRLSVKNSAAAFTGAPTRSEPVDELATPTNGALAERTIAGAAMTLLAEFSQETRGWPLPFALLGLAVALRRGKPKAGWTPAAVAFVGGCAMLALLWQRAGFMAGRLLLPLMPFALFAAAAGLESTGRGLVRTVLAAWPPHAIRRSALGGAAW